MLNFALLVQTSTEVQSWRALAVSSSHFVQFISKHCYLIVTHCRVQSVGTASVTDAERLVRDYLNRIIAGFRYPYIYRQLQHPY